MYNIITIRKSKRPPNKNKNKMFVTHLPTLKTKITKKVNDIRIPKYIKISTIFNEALILHFKSSFVGSTMLNN